MSILLWPSLIITMSTLLNSGNEFVFPHDGELREYRLHVPDELPEDASLVLVLHGYGMSTQEMMEFYNWPEIADERGFIVAFPEGLSDQTGLSFWDVDWPFHEGIDNDDTGFLRELALHLESEHSLAQDETCVAGFSLGAFMCYQLACDESDTFEAIAAVGGSMLNSLESKCNPEFQRPILAINGTADPDVLFKGESKSPNGWGPYLSIPSVINFWTNLVNTPFTNSSTLPDTNPNDGSTVSLDVHSHTMHHKEVWFYTLNGGGHDWPGSYGNLDFNASVDIANFFDRMTTEPCLGDVNNSGNVSIEDLLILIGQISDCNGACSGNFDDDDDVDINDLLILLDQWNVECPTWGACCLDNGNCVYVEKSACLTTNGVWNGKGSSCVTTQCDILSNDECEGATSISIGKTPFSTLDATTSSDAFDESMCSTSYLGGVNNDVWFTYDADCTGSLTLSTCSTASFDTDIVLYEGTCETKVQIACNGDSDNCDNYTSELTTKVIEGNTYLIRLGGWWGDSAGTGSLTISCD